MYSKFINYIDDFIINEKITTSDVKTNKTLNINKIQTLIIYKIVENIRILCGKYLNSNIFTFVLTIALLNLIVAFMSNAFDQDKELKNAYEQKALNNVILSVEIYFKED